MTADAILLKCFDDYDVIAEHNYARKRSPASACFGKRRKRPLALATTLETISVDEYNTDSGYTSDSSETDIHEIVDDLKHTYREEIQMDDKWPVYKKSNQQLADEICLHGERFYLFDDKSILKKCKVKALRECERAIRDQYSHTLSCKLPELTADETEAALAAVERGK